MLQVIGRVTADARVNHVQDGRKVTNFSIALNANYKPKGSEETKQIVTYMDCSYWVHSKVAKLLTKGSLVELLGNIGMRVYKTSDGEPRGSITLHVQTIKIHGFGKGSTTTNTAPVSATAVEEETEDLPF